MIKAIIFDVGGVLDKGGWKEHYLPMCKELKIDSYKFSESQQKHIKKARVGKISTKQYISLIAKDMNVKPSLLLKSWIKWKKRALVKDKGVEKTIRKLKKRYIVGTLTNIIELHHKIRLKKNIYNLFDFKLCSHEQKLCKPQIKFYKLIFQKLKKISPKETVFVDDWKDALIPAKKLGMKTILFKNNKQLIRDLIRLGVKIKK